MSEITLDPADWDGMRALSHQVLDAMLDHLQQVRERPTWQPVPDAVRREIKAPLPRTGLGLAAAWDAARRLVVPYAWGNIHPRFWGWVNGAGTPGGVVAELVTATLNTNASIGQQAALFVEQQVLEWSRELMGFPEGSSGLLVTGGSVANLVALTVARDRLGGDVAQRGLQEQPAPPVVYASVQAHNSVDKAVMILGLGREACRRIAVNAAFQMDVDALRRAIAADRTAGRLPCAVVGSAGTVGTGACDDLDALADLCAEEGLWLHVDGAFGAMAALVPALRPLVRGMERADSLAFDFHKWLQVPYDAGCVLIRDGAAHAAASFNATASYLATLDRGAAAGPTDFSRIGPELSREFRALKIWMSLLEHGVDTFAALVEQNVTQARYLAERIRASSELELLAPVPLNVVCYRFTGGVPEAERNALNQLLLTTLQERGIAVPSSFLIDGRFALRVAITNHRSRQEDFDVLVDASITIGRELADVATAGR